MNSPRGSSRSLRRSARTARTSLSFDRRRRARRGRLHRRRSRPFTPARSMSFAAALSRWLRRDLRKLFAERDERLVVREPDDGDRRGAIGEELREHGRDPHILDVGEEEHDGAEERGAPLPANARVGEPLLRGRRHSGIGGQLQERPHALGAIEPIRHRIEQRPDRAACLEAPSTTPFCSRSAFSLVVAATRSIACASSGARFARHASRSASRSRI